VRHDEVKGVDEAPEEGAMSTDMTIESALSDPMIRALMRADRVEAKSFERLLRSAAGTLDRAPRTHVPAVVTQRPTRPVFQGFCCV
jgi:hypothetical protein